MTSGRTWRWCTTADGCSSEPRAAGVRVYGATANQTAGSLQTTLTLPAGAGVRGLSVDRDLNCAVRGQ